MSKGNVLIINENIILTKVLEKTLAGEGYKVASTNNGIEAYDIISQDLPDFIILDLMISFVTGYELIEYIRGIESKYIKIVVLTNISLEGVIQESFNLGVDDFMTLPLQQKELLARINRLSRYTLAG